MKKLINGGSGHEPMHGGFVGPGMLEELPDQAELLAGCWSCWS